MLIHTFTNHDEAHRHEKDIVIKFADRRNVLGTSAFHGGYREDLKYVFNFDEKPMNDCNMEAPTYEGHLEWIAKNKIHLDPASCSGLSTAATMENVSVKEMSVTLKDSSVLTVTAVITGGIDKNGARVGDPACWQEIDGKYYDPVPGTINILLHINADLSKGAMARAIVTATEAKTAAVGELLCPSLYSEGIATGSGTDGIIVVSNPGSSLRLTAAGKDSQLGEMIGKTVKEAVKETIALQTDVTPEFQHNALRRLDRFGLNEEELFEQYKNLSKRNQAVPVLEKEEFEKISTPLLRSGEWTGKASLLAHLFDQLSWEMLTREEVEGLSPVLFPRVHENLSDSNFHDDVKTLKKVMISFFCLEFFNDLFPGAEILK